ncbi:uncharacterized protein FTJAE_7831 [Fusarium tjaetaba]|uniref:Actin-like ATPase domain-containing protein n=1 Tax=Fusarium tjaetaba TaxID=1567544 RepID=A0A8H5R9G9_9HYPO|nr:uncharacterized protein FTJAE_7831 [Fusarium tjaetaba]KAF5631630.1 hypothetical protein FTJAE_7831 [Fusarium tjaetaba]
MAEDLVVGIDVGMTGTGVAYRRKGYAKVTALGWGIDEKVLKTPTRLYYNVHYQPPKLVGWGMEVPDDSTEHLKLKEGFKLDLGEVDADQVEVERMYRDFLTCLFRELSTQRFTPAFLGGKQFEETRVLFLFSVPALWDPAVVHDFTQLIRESGFEKEGVHSVRVAMTEPQAVAAYEICVPNSDYKLKVTCKTGSTYIDRGFEEMVMTYLQDKRDSLVGDIEHVSLDMRNSNLFLETKHAFDPDTFEDLKFDIPFKNSARHDSKDSPPPATFVLTGEYLGSLFNRQIDVINEEIRRFIRAFVTDSGTNSDNHLGYIVLAGGLGSSRYVQGKVEKFIQELPFKPAEKPKLVMSAAPRLAVCMGLVHNAGRNPELFPRRFNRVSIGVASQSLTGEIKKSRFRSFMKRAFLRAPKGQKPGGGSGGELVPDRVTLHEQTAYFSADLPSDKRTWELAILHSFESDIDRLTLGGQPRTSDDARQILTHTDNCRVHSVLRVNLSHIGVPEKTGTGDALSRLHLAPKPKVPIKFDLRIEVGLATAEIYCTDKKGRLCSEPMSIEIGQESESLPSTGQSAVHELS